MKELALLEEVLSLLREKDKGLEFDEAMKFASPGHLSLKFKNNY